MADPLCPKGNFTALAEILDAKKPVYVQTHDFPDLDAVASAWALADLLRRRGFIVECVYRGRIRSRSLQRLVLEFHHSLCDSLPLAMTASGRGQIVVVDGSPANGNVSLFPGDLVGIIDHHCSTAVPVAAYIDLRPELAACSTIIQGYYEAENLEVPRDLATALIAGIQSDTDFLSRRADPEDFAAYSALYRLGDFVMASHIVRTVFDLADLALATRALSSSVVENGIFWAFLEGECSQEVLAVLAEFVLRTEEIRAAIVAEHDLLLGGVHLSIRSKDPGLSAFDLVRRALEGLGSGGGHSHSAGGLVPDSTFPGEGALRERFFAAVREFPA